MTSLHATNCLSPDSAVGHCALRKTKIGITRPFFNLWAALNYQNLITFFISFFFQFAFGSFKTTQMLNVSVSRYISISGKLLFGSILQRNVTSIIDIKNLGPTICSNYCIAKLNKTLDCLCHFPIHRLWRFPSRSRLRGVILKHRGLVFFVDTGSFENRGWAI